MVKKKKKKDWRSKFIFAFVLVLAGLFTSTAFLIAIGMLPTIVAYFVDRSKEKLKPLTVGAMNFAGCFPYVMELWVSGDHSIDAARGLLADPKAIVVMYMAALIGYLIDWSVSGLVAQMAQQKAKARIKVIHDLQKSLVERWGEEVKGTIPLGEDGFPIESEMPEKSSNK